MARRVNHIVAKGDNPAWPKGSKSRGFSICRGTGKAPWSVCGINGPGWGQTGSALWARHAAARRARRRVAGALGRQTNADKDKGVLFPSVLCCSRSKGKIQGTYSKYVPCILKYPGHIFPPPETGVKTVHREAGKKTCLYGARRAVPRFMRGAFPPCPAFRKNTAFAFWPVPAFFIPLRDMRIHAACARQAVQ